MNFYERPAQQQFIDTYAALPFQEMAMLGQMYKQETDKAEAAIDAFKSKYGDFTSMSAADTAAWDKETFSKIEPALSQIAKNPEYIKSQEGQAELRKLARSVDTKKLGELRQSSENLQKRAAVIAQLQAQGKYKKSWDNIDIANWDTTKQGIMTDLSPLEYKDLHDIASPYSQALKDQYLGKIDRYRYWVGVDENQIRQSLNNAATDIFSTPQGTAWYNDIKTEMAAKGVTDPTAVKEEMMNRLVQSQKDYMRKNIAYDDAAIKMDVAASRKKGSEKTLPVQPARYTDEIRMDGKRFLNKLATNLPISFTTEDTQALKQANMNLQIAMLKNNPRDISMAQAQKDSILNQQLTGSFDTLVANNFKDAIGKDDLKSVSYKDLVAGSRSVIDELSTDNPHAGATSILESVANRSVKSNGDEIFTMNNTRYLQNPTTVVSNLKGINLKKKANTFDKLLNGGAFKNVRVEPVTTKGLFNYVDKDGNFKQKQRVIVTVDADNIDLAKVRSEMGGWDSSKFDGIMRANGADITVDKAPVTVREGENVAAGNTKAAVSSGITKRGSDKKRYTFEMFIDVPEDNSEVQGKMVSDINTVYNRKRRSSAHASNDYPIEQMDAFYGARDASVSAGAEEELDDYINGL